MLRALAIETTGRTASVALAEDGVPVAGESFNHGLNHAAGLLPLIDRLTKQVRWKPTEIDHVYVSIGPGSFTGLRIGVTMAKVLALSVGCRVVAVPTMRVLVENAPADAVDVMIVLDARRGQVFTSHFRRSGFEWEAVAENRLMSPADLGKGFNSPVYLVGEGLAHHAVEVGDVIELTDESTWTPRAEVVMTLGHAFAAAGHFADPLSLRPVYMRRPEAEENRLKQSDDKPEIV